eukprot:scaffold15398_cov97-Isochrysis_galbana.AAC.2
MCSPLDLPPALGSAVHALVGAALDRLVGLARHDGLRPACRNWSAGGHRPQAPPSSASLRAPPLSPHPPLTKHKAF